MLHPEGPQIAADLEYLEEYLEVLEYFGASFEIYLTVSIHRLLNAQVDKHTENTHENTKTTSTQGKYTHKTHTITQTSPLTKGGAHISSLTKTPIMTSPPGQLIS